jgi:hypothetical protein
MMMTMMMMMIDRYVCMYIAGRAGGGTAVLLSKELSIARRGVAPIGLYLNTLLLLLLLEEETESEP